MICKSMASPFLISVLFILQSVLSTEQMSRQERQLPLLLFPPTSPTRVQVNDKLQLTVTHVFTLIKCSLR